MPMGRIHTALLLLRRRLMRSKRSRSILLYLFFVAVSAVFWSFITFNDRVPIKMTVAVEVVHRPENVRFITPMPDTLTIEAQGRFSSFLGYLFGQNLKLKPSFADYSDGDGRWVVSADRLRMLVEATLKNKNIDIKSIQPESLSALYTDQPGKAVPVFQHCVAAPALGYVRTGVTEQSVDTVLIYGNAARLRDITQVDTYELNLNDLTDTVRKQLKINPIEGVLVEPSTIEVMVPIEMLINETRLGVRVQVRNVPDSTRVLTFPFQVNAHFRTPKSYAHKKDAPLTAVVDYSQIDISSPSTKVAVVVGEAAGVFQDIRFEPDSVEYLIEYVSHK